MTEIGDRFGRLLVKASAPSPARRKDRKRYWFCVCDCGVEKVVYDYYLTSGRTVSCGCWKRTKSLKPIGVAALNRKLDYYKKNASRKGLEFKLGDEEAKGLFKGACRYCGCIPEVTRSPSSLNGIDRIDSRNGYVVGNVVPCCRVCNQAKHTMLPVAFIGWIRQVHEYLSQKDFKCEDLLKP